MCYGEVVSSSMQTARKQGKPCAECGRPISPGSRYVMHSTRGYDDGLLSKWKLCRRCAAYVEARWQDGDLSCPMDYQEEFAAHAKDDRRGARAKLRAAWDRITKGKRYNRRLPPPSTAEHRQEGGRTA